MKRLLLVDDDADLLDCLTTLLGDAYEIVAAGNGAEAVFATARHEFDAIVLDLVMPVLDGAGVMEELRTRKVSIPVLIASAAMDVREEAKRLGAADYVSKPFEVADLEAKLARIVEMAPTRDSSESDA